jgi:hypothetical protein
MQLSEIKKGFARDKKNKFGVLDYGSGLSQGIYAIVAVCKLSYQGEPSFSEISIIAETVLERWIEFENFAINRSDNDNYFRIYTDPQTGVQREDLNFSNYYKGKTVARDLRDFFAKSH